MTAARTPEEVLRDAIAHACDLWQQGWDGGPDDVAEEAAQDLRSAGLLVTPEHDREVAAGALESAAAAWQTGGWSGSFPAGTGRPALILGMAQRATTWLRARADRVRRGEG